MICQIMQICDILATILNLAAILKIKENNFPRNRFLGLENIHLDLFYCFLRHLQAKICKILDFGGHLGKMADRKTCSTFGVWLQTDLDSAAQNLMETIIKVYICLKTRSREISIDRCSDYIAEEISGFQHLFPNLQPIDARKGIQLPKTRSNTHGQTTA